jgi:hypothetical protein
MHQHRSAGRPGEVAPPGTVEHEHQRRLLLELAVDPPERGDAIAELARTLGLAERREGRLFATPAVAAVERLWPFGL